MKTQEQEIDVEVHNGVPAIVSMQGRLHIVTRVLDSWRYRSRWWDEEEERNYWWLMTDVLTVLVYQSRRGWFSSQVWD